MTEIEYWRTTAISPLPPGWVVVVERGGGTLDPWPCPALLLQEAVGGSPDYPPETRVMPACHAGDGGFDDPMSADDAVYITTTSEDWETMRPEAERDVAAGRAHIKERMLAQIAEAGAEGVRATDLISEVNRLRCVDVRDQLQREGLVVTAWERDDAAFDGKVCVCRLATEQDQP